MCGGNNKTSSSLCWQNEDVCPGTGTAPQLANGLMMTQDSCPGWSIAELAEAGGISQSHFVMDLIDTGALGSKENRK